MSEELTIRSEEPGSELLVLTTTQTNTQTRRLIASIPAMSDEELFRCAQFAEELGKSAYLIRGAVGAEIRKRYPALSGRGQDAEEAGRKARLKQLASQHGVSLRAIEDDASIYTTFVATADPSDSDVAITLLPLEREYYRLALRAEDPHAAIEQALRQKEEDPAYSSRDFRAYVQVERQKEGRGRNRAKREEPQPFRMQVKGATVIVEAGEDNSPQRVLDILTSVVQRLTRQREFIAALQKLQVDIEGEVPTFDDFYRSGARRDLDDCIAEFDSFPRAREAAGIVHENLSPEEWKRLLLRDLSAVRGITGDTASNGLPSREEYIFAASGGRVYSMSVYLRYFRNWEHVMREIKKLYGKL
jgi:hypothetical protein